MGNTISCVRSQSRKPDHSQTELPPIPGEEEAVSEKYVVKALYDYQGVNEGDLKFKKGDRMEIDLTVTEETEYRWMAIHSKSKERGYIPSNYVTKDDNSIESQDWWYDIDRETANSILIHPPIKIGTFIVRKSSESGMYALSVLTRDENEERYIKQYKILVEGGKEYYIFKKDKFSSLMELIEYYKGGGLCCKLTEACPKTRPTTVPPFRELEVHASSLQFKQKLGQGYFGEVHKEAVSEKYVVKALYDYQGVNEGDLKFKKGDRMEIDLKVTEETEDWCMAIHSKSKERGYIPRNYVTKDDNSIESQDWWYDIDRETANSILIHPSIKIGTFIVRKSSKSGMYALSVLTRDKNEERYIKQYKILVEGGKEYYIFKKDKDKFSSLVELVEYYKGGGLCCKLTEACPKTRPTTVPPFRELEVHKEAVSEKYVVKALYDYHGVNEGDLKFKKGDRMEIDLTVTEETGDWWMAVHSKSKERGYIPRNYVTKDDNSIESQDWWYDIDRETANSILIHPSIKIGTFIVRKSSEFGIYALSVLTRDENGERYTKQYKILVEGGKEYYIVKKDKFCSLMELIEYYKGGGLCCKLTEACPKIRPTTVPPFRELEVHASSLQFKQKLGEGHFGEVHKGRYRNRKDVAIKTLKPDRMPAKKFLEEAKLMHELYHPKLVTLLAICLEPLMIVAEFMPNGSLLDYLRSDSRKELKFEDIIHFASQIAEGMAFLESKNFIHRDLRADNILVGENHEVKVADFGLAKCLEDKGTVSDDAKYPVKWTAPEAFLRREFSVKSDVWSFGVVLYELITFGKQLYIGWTGRQVTAEVERGYRLPKPRPPTICTDEYYDVMKSCWNDEPAERPTFKFLSDRFANYKVSTDSQNQSY